MRGTRLTPRRLIATAVGTTAILVFLLLAPRVSAQVGTAPPPSPSGTPIRSGMPPLEPSGDIFLSVGWPIPKEERPKVLERIDGVSREMLPRACEQCRAIDAVSTLLACERGSYRLAIAGTAALVDVEYLCRMSPADQGRPEFTLRVQLPAALGKGETGWTATPIVFAPMPREAPPPGDEFVRGPYAPWEQRAIPAGPPPELPLRSRLFNLIRPTMIWWPESFGILLVGGLIYYVTRGGGMRRQGLRGGLTALNIVTGLIGGFCLGLMIWWALPEQVVYGGPGGSTPLYLYLVLPAPLGAMGSILSWVLLGVIWPVVLKERARGVPQTLATLQVLFCAITLAVILMKVVPR